MKVIVRLVGDGNFIYKNVVRFTFNKNKMYLFGINGNIIELCRRNVKLSEVVDDEKIDESISCNKFFLCS